MKQYNKNKAVSLLLGMAIIFQAALAGCAAPQTATPTATMEIPTMTSTVEPTSTSIPSATPAPALVGLFVSTGGDDANDGSEAAPWRHIQFALDQAKAGDTVYVMAGEYNEMVAFHTPGSAEGGYITLQNYPGQAPVIDGTGLSLGEEPGLVAIDDMAYVKLIGFEIRNLKAGGNPDIFPAGIWVRGSGDHIEIRNNLVHDIENSCEECGAHGIGVYGSDADVSIHDLLIDGNEVRNNKLGWSESLVLNGNVEKFVVSNNVVHDNDNIGIDLIGFEETAPDPAVDRARDGLVIGNLVYNIDSYGNPAYGDERSSDGIYVDGGTNIVIERNTVHNVNIGIELASEHQGKNTSYITVRNNFIYNNTQVGIAFGGYDEQRGSTENCVIVNNTLFNNATQGDWGAELYIQFDTRDNIVRNNIIYAGKSRLFLESWSDVMTGNVIDNNLFFAAGGGTDGVWIWQGEEYDDFAAYQQASGNDANSLIGVDPLFVSLDSPDLHLQTGSPAIDRGTDLPEAGTEDIDGQARIQNAIDLGADEVR
jgi:parallel beta-helix repeat protein